MAVIGFKTGRNLLALYNANGFIINATRAISTIPITKNISLISKDKLNSKLNKFQLQPHIDDKPLVIIPSWLLAQRKHIHKYCELYFNRGFSVLNISVTPWQMLWPTKGTQLVVNDLLKFLENNFRHSPLMVHGFSVGGYVWGELLVKMAAELSRYQPVLDRFVGQVWDSAADITEIPHGFPFAVFPTNLVMQKALRQYIIYHMKTFDKIATCHYVRSSQMFHTTILKCPALFYLSKVDPVGAEKANQRVRENWESMGMQVYWKCFDDSKHVGHLAKYPKDYIDTLNVFIDKAMANRQSEKCKIQLEN